MSGDGPPNAPKRADAERNRARILAAARTAFAAAPGAEVSMAEISRRAGVGMATLYRNFPSRHELLEALYTDHVDAFCEAAAAVGSASPGAAFRAWLHEFLAYFAGKRNVASELLKHSGDGAPVFGQSRARVLASGRALLVAAQEASEVRGDLTLEQVLDMVIAIARIDGDPTYVQPILDAALDGLRPRPVPLRTT